MNTEFLPNNFYQAPTGHQATADYPVHQGRVVFSPEESSIPTTIQQHQINETPINNNSIEKYLLNERKIKLANIICSNLDKLESGIFSLITKQKIENKKFINLNLPKEKETIFNNILKELEVIKGKNKFPIWNLSVLAVTIAVLYHHSSAEKTNQLLSLNPIEILSTILELASVFCVNYAFLNMGYNIYYAFTSPEVYLSKIIASIKIGNGHTRKDYIDSKPDIFSIIPSPLKHINLPLVFNAIHQNLSLERSDILQLTKAFLVGIITTWMDLNRESITSSLIENSNKENKKRLDNSIISSIVKHTLSCLYTNKEFTEYSNIPQAADLDDPVKLPAILTQQILKQDQQDRDEDKKKWMPPVSHSDHVKKLTSLTNGYYSVDSPYGNILQGSIFLINNNASSKPKYTYYQPFDELECSTHSPEEFIDILRKMFFNIDFKFKLIG